MSNSSFRVKNNLIIGHKATNPILQFEGGSDNGYIDYTVSRTKINAGGGYLEYIAGNATRMIIDTSGNIQVGDQSTVSNGLRYFDINNLASTTGSTTGSIVRLITSNTAGTGTTSFDIVKYKSGAVLFNNNEPNSAAFISFTVVDEKLRICSNGHVGIGITAPARKLDIQQSSTDYQMRIGDAGSNYYDIGRNTTDGLLTFYGNQTAASGYKFSTVDGDRMIIRTNGNIGINGSASADTTYRWLTIYGPSTSGGGMIHLYNSDSTVGINMFNNNLAGYFGTSTAHPLVFRINNGEVARFDTGGNLLIGTDTNIGQTVQLQLSGYNSTGGTGYHTFLAVKNTYGSATTPTKYFRLNTTGGIEIINSAYSAILLTLDNSGNLTALANITAYSDVNLKTDISTIDNALDKVSRMRGVMFTRKDTGTRGTGVIAQEIQKILPEVVQEGENLSVAYGNIVGVLIEAIKELKAEIETLKGK